VNAPGTRRFVTIADYQRQTGLSYPTIKKALETGQLRGIRTEAGYWKIDIQADGKTDISAILQRLDVQECLLRALCEHLGMKLGRL